MANVLSKKTLNIDTAATITIGGSAQLDIRQMVWQGAANTNTLVLTINGQAITWTHLDAIHGALCPQQILQNPVGIVDNFVVTTIDGGNLFVFLN